MDSYPYKNNNAKFVDLLNSQQEVVFGFGQDTGEVSSSQVPLFGTQRSEDSHVPEDSPAERKERRAWTPPDDILLISSWLNTSKDPVVGNEQKSGAFWKRIAAYFAASQKVAGSEVREHAHCKNRWHKINDQVGKFCGAYEAATREKSSGQNENDVLKLAHEIFFNNHQKKFTLEHAWKELRNDQKWCKLSTSKSERSSEEEASKGLTKQKTKAELKAAAEFDTMWSIKKEDFAMKERMSRMKLLESLIAKQEPLADYEEALKKKLISELQLIRNRFVTGMKRLVTDELWHVTCVTVCSVLSVCVTDCVKRLVGVLSVCVTACGTVCIGAQEERKKRIYIERNREEGDVRLWNDYFSETPTYPDNIFRRRFRMNKPLFLRIVHHLPNEVDFFRQKKDCLGRLSLSPLQKCTAAIRLLAYGGAADTVDEYLRLGATTTRSCLEHFVEGIINLFGEEYLRRPTPADLQRLLDIGEHRGFPGIIGSIDCMHWEWKNCLTAWKGQYSRGSGKPTIILEAVASYDLWIWHAFFGPLGTLNDINVLDRSPVFDDIIKGLAPQVTFSVNGREYHLAYYLTDGIYPKWATFIQSIPIPQGPKAVLFAQHQEAVRKDVERAFGVLQALFAIVKNPALFWDKVKIGKIMRAYIILHNMIVEDERDGYTQYDVSEFQQGEDIGGSQVDLTYSTDIPTNIANMMGVRTRIRDTQMHQQLKGDLVEHLWRKFGHYQDNN
uniref:Myb-like domain-containing protein n=2 Tax=Brassica oleracea var. oleracea TaxID=109376 RepID=A0A0D3EED8_BRAOL